MRMMFDVSLLPILAGGVASVLIGMVWYAPRVFGAQWMKSAGLREEDTKVSAAVMARSVFIGFVAAVALSWVLAHFSLVWGAMTFGSALELGFWVWLGFMMPLSLSPVLWERKPLLYGIINGGYWLAVAIVVSIIVTLWS